MPGPRKSTPPCKHTKAPPVAAACRRGTAGWRTAVIATFLGAALLAAPARAENILDIYRLALANDPEFLAARATFLAEKQKIPEARALLLPELFASANYQRNDSKTTIDRGGPNERVQDVQYNASGYALSLRQPLFNSAAWAGLKQAKASVRKAASEFASAKQSLLTRTAAAYFAVLRAKDNLDLAIAEKAAVKGQLDLTSARLEAGLSTITEVHEARAQYEFTEAEEIDARNRLDDAREALRTLTGRSVGQLKRLRPENPLLTPDPPDIEKWVENALQHNLALKAAEAAVDIAKEEIRIQRAGHWPTLDLVGNSSLTDSTGSSFSIADPNADIRRENNSIGLELNIPLIQGGLVSALTKESKYRYTAAEYASEKQRRSTIRSTRSAYLGVISSAKRIVALKQSVIAGESALEAKQEGFQAGISTNKDVLDAQRNLYRAKRDYSDSRYSYLVNFLLLKEAAGILSEEDLARINDWLQ